MALAIYREISQPPRFLAEWLDARNQLWEIVDDADVTHWFIDNDVPRDPEINEQIVGREPYIDDKGRRQHPVPGITIGFAVFYEDDSGEMVYQSSYSRLDKAERAVAGARTVVQTEIELEEEPEWESLAGSEAPDRGGDRGASEEDLPGAEASDPGDPGDEPAAPRTVLGGRGGASDTGSAVAEAPDPS